MGKERDPLIRTLGIKTGLGNGEDRVLDIWKIQSLTYTQVFNYFKISGLFTDNTIRVNFMPKPSTYIKTCVQRENRDLICLNIQTQACLACAAIETKFKMAKTSFSFHVTNKSFMIIIITNLLPCSLFSFDFDL